MILSIKVYISDCKVRLTSVPGVYELAYLK